jgi:putative nucleotidyltransferase with HDIG domain
MRFIFKYLFMVGTQDHGTYSHAKKVGRYATGIAEALGYSKEDIKRIRAAALLHDIGKIGIADRLLQKSEALTPDERELIRTHPDLGVSIIKHVGSLRGCLAAVQYHHERYDGTGYPRGLYGSTIPLDARILAVADSYDAMISSRPYRLRPLTHEQALEELKQCAGAQFDPAVVEAFVEIHRPSS